MGRFIVFLTGAGSGLVGAASYFTAIPLPFDCKRVVCTIATSIITLDMVLMGGGIFLILLAIAAGKSRT